VLIELFSLGVTAEELRRISVENRRFRCKGGQADTKFQVEWVAPTNHSSFQKTRINDLLYGIKIWTGLSFVLSQFTRLADRWTEQTDRRLSHR